jgi:hypothetical protein
MCNVQCDVRCAMCGVRSSPSCGSGRLSERPHIVITLLVSLALPTFELDRARASLLDPQIISPPRGSTVWRIQSFNARIHRGSGPTHPSRYTPAIPVAFHAGDADREVALLQPYSYWYSCSFGYTSRSGFKRLSSAIISGTSTDSPRRVVLFAPSSGGRSVSSQSASQSRDQPRSIQDQCLSSVSVESAAMYPRRD